LVDEGPLIVYTGKVYVGMKEIEHLVYAAQHLPHCRFLMTGGQPAAIIELQFDLQTRGIDNVRLTGFLENPEITQLYQQAADVLVSYYSAQDHPYARHNLPNKLAEYMSTGNPVVVADFPAVHDWATAETAALVEPDNPAALVETILRLLEDRGRAAQMADSARRLAERRSFQQVASEVSAFLVAHCRLSI
jgi:glycosyltransferase involved in cell wall biosynthesis